MPITIRTSSAASSTKATRSATTLTPTPTSRRCRRSCRINSSTPRRRILENLLGVSTTFFRPPYNADSVPETPEELAPVNLAKHLGYATIAETIDPRDWEPGISADAIVNEVNNEIGNGHIVRVPRCRRQPRRHRCRFCRA